MQKILVIDGKPHDSNVRFVNFTHIPEADLPDWSDHAQDILNIMRSYRNVAKKVELIFGQVVENDDGDDSYLLDQTNHVNLNRALLWAVEQGIKYVYMSFSFGSKKPSQLCWDTDKLAKYLEIYCPSENTKEEYELYKNMVYCPSKTLATYVSRKSIVPPKTLNYGEDYTSRLTARAIIEKIIFNKKIL